MSSNRFRPVALSLPGVIEGSHQGHADFRAGKRFFATLGYPDQEWGMLMLTPEQQSLAWTNVAPKALLTAHQKLK